MPLFGGIVRITCNGHLVLRYSADTSTFEESWDSTPTYIIDDSTLALEIEELGISYNDFSFYLLNSKQEQIFKIGDLSKDQPTLEVTILQDYLKDPTLYIKVNNQISPSITNKLAPSLSQIQISCSTPDSQIYYTLDNSTPDSSKSLYSNQFEVESGTTIKAIAIKDGYINSDVAEYTVN